MRKKLFVALMLAFGFTFIFSTAMAFPPMPRGLQLMEPDPSLPKDLKDYWGKWEGKAAAKMENYSIIIEKIDDKKAILWLAQRGGWDKHEANVVEDLGKYKVWYRGRQGLYEFSLKGEKLIWSVPFMSSSIVLTRVP